MDTEIPNDDRTKIVHGRALEWAKMVANIRRAAVIAAALNRLTFNDADEVRTVFSELIGQSVDTSLMLIPPFYIAGGDEFAGVDECGNARRVI